MTIGTLIRRIILYNVCGVYRFIALSVSDAQPKTRKCDKFVIFSVFSFGCLGRNSYICSDVCNMLIINGYFRFCDMGATSGANALIVS